MKIILLIIAVIIMPVYAVGADNQGTVTSNDNVTWTFATSTYTTGQFVSGDWWVIPDGDDDVDITAISPTPDSENGSMLNPVPASSGNTQGWNQTAGSYSSELNVGLNLPLALSVGDVLVSAVDGTYSTETKSHIAGMEILTVVSSDPGTNAFRPGYCDSSNTIYTTASINFDHLEDLTDPGNAPSLSTIEDWFKRPHVDIMGGATGFRPYNNMYAYGREYSTYMGIASLLIHLNYTDAQKQNLVYGLIQVGIDFYSVVTYGTGWTGWHADGARHYGRKFPIMFAGKMLNNQDFMDIGDVSGDYITDGSYGPGNRPPDYITFSEDSSSFYVTSDEVSTGSNYTSNHIGMPEWGIRHDATPAQDNASWTADYRSLNGHRWAGYALSAKMLEMKPMWNHDAFFDYVERYMAISNGDSDPFGYTVINEGVSTRTAGSAFVISMYDNYWDSYTGVPSGGGLSTGISGSITMQ